MSKLPENASDAATMHVGSDRYPYTVTHTSKSGHCITLRSDNYMRTDDNGQSEDQRYDFYPYSQGVIVKAYRGKDGRYRCKGSLVTVGRRSAYQNPSF